MDIQERALNWALQQFFTTWFSYKLQDSLHRFVLMIFSEEISFVDCIVIKWQIILRQMLFLFKSFLTCYLGHCSGFGSTHKIHCFCACNQQDRVDSGNDGGSSHQDVPAPRRHQAGATEADYFWYTNSSDCCSYWRGLRFSSSLYMCLNSK